MKIFSTFLIIFILFWSINISYGEENKCKYNSQIEECENSISKHNIEEFICIEWNRENMIYNLILDIKFKEIDKKADEYLLWLEENKSRFFWPKKKETYIDWIIEIEKKLGKYGFFYNKYMKENKLIISDTINCIWKTQVWVVKDFFWSSSLINNLVIKKINIRKQVAFDILLLNKKQVRADSKKLYVQQKRTNYDLISNLLLENMWFLLRIAMKWATKTKTVW